VADTDRWNCAGRRSTQCRKHHPARSL